MFDRLSDLVSEHAELERALADPAYTRPGESAHAGRRYAELTPIVHAYREWQQTAADEEAPELGGLLVRAEAEQPPRTARARGQLQKLLVRATPTTAATSSSEVKAGEGGEESALFAC